MFKPKPIKFKVAPSYFNDAVFVLLGIDIPTTLLESSTYVGCCLSCEVIEHIRFYLSALEFMIKYSNTVPCNL